MSFTHPYKGFMVYVRKRGQINYFEVKGSCPVHGTFYQAIYTNDRGDVNTILDQVDFEAHKTNELPDTCKILQKVLSKYPHLTSPHIVTKSDLVNEVIRLSESDYRESWDTFSEIFDRQKEKIIEDILEGKTREYWQLIKFPRLKKIWEDYVRYGFVRDEKGVEEIKYICIRNIAKLVANTQFVGHTQVYPEEIVDDYLEFNNLCFKKKKDKPKPFVDPNQLKLQFPNNPEVVIDPQEEEDYREEIPYTKEEFFDRLDVYIGDDKFSDYATAPLVKLSYDLIEADDPVEQLLLCDRIFNVVHMRGDIAALFVEGGSSALSALSGEHADAQVYRPMEEIYRVAQAYILSEGFQGGSDIDARLKSLVAPTITNFMRDINGKQRWTVVPFEMWRRVRTEFFRYGFIRSEKALQNVVDIVTHNVLQIIVNTMVDYFALYNRWQEELSMMPNDHELKQIFPYIEKACEQYRIDKEDLDMFDEYAQDDKGITRATDAARAVLLSNIKELAQESDPVQQVVILDHIFDISHQRSDLASWLIEGGTASLSKLTA